MAEAGVKRTIVSKEAAWHLDRAEKCEEMARKHEGAGGNAALRELNLYEMARHRWKADELLLDFQLRAERLRSMLRDCWARSAHPQNPAH